MAKPVCVGDFEEQARKVLPKYAYDFYASGANDELTLKENCRAYSRYAQAGYFVLSPSQQITVLYILLFV